MTVDELRQPHPDQERIDREAAALLLATKSDQPARVCDALDPDTCLWCDHYPECAANEPENPDQGSPLPTP